MNVAPPDVAPLAVAAPLLLALGALSRVRAARTSPDARRVLAASVLMTVALTLNVDPVYLAFDRATVANLANLVEHVTGVVAAGLMVQAAHSSVTGRRAPRALTAALGASVVVMAVAFVAAWVPAERRDFTGAAMDAGHVTAARVYWVSGLVWVGYVTWHLGVMAWRHAPGVPRRAARAGLRMVLCGSALGLVWSAVRTVEVLAVRPGPVPAWFDLATRVLLVTSMPLIGLGLAVPGLLGSWRALPGHLRSVTLHLRLRPLWRRTTAAAPHVVLPGGGRLLRDPAGALHRRVVEITDALVSLRAPDGPATDPAVRADAARALQRVAEAGSRTPDAADPTRTLHDQAVALLVHADPDHRPQEDHP